MGVIIRCDICEEEFTIEQATTGKTNIDNLRVSYFTCPKCGHNYVYLLEDYKQSQILKRLQNLRDALEIRRLNGKTLPAARMRQLNKLTEESQAYQTILRDKHIKAVTAQLNSGY